MRALIFLAACAGADVAPPTPPPAIVATPTPDEEPDEPVAHPAELPAGPVADAATPEASSADASRPASDEVWLRGSTHVHAKPSGDSTEPLPNVIAWYRKHHYDFIVLTDHNKVSDPGGAGVGAKLDDGFVVISGVELTHNPSGCLPIGDKSKKCRIHVNAIGPTERPSGKIDWPDRKHRERLAKYQSALDEAKVLHAALVQINHPQWYWGMTADLLAELARRGASLVEIANIQFTKWNAGDKDHASTEALWDGALAQGVTLWGVASDDAHSYRGDKHEQWPAGGGWIVVHARRDPQAIVDAIAAGHFYASTGVELSHAEAANGELVVEVVDSAHTKIAFIENGVVVETVDGHRAHRAIPAKGYLRAVVTRDDGKQAWVQPVRG